MANHALPTTDSSYVDYTDELKARDEDAARQFDPAYTSPTNILTHTYRLNSAAAKWQRWNGTSWVDAVTTYAISISGNAGTATRLATARTIGGVSFDGTANINLPGVNTAGNQNTSGNAATATVAASCSGNAATASSVAWTSVTGRPTAVSAFTNDSSYITSAGRAYPRMSDGGDINFFWSGQSGQPFWLWGGNDGANMYVYNPSNFSVAYATSAGSASSVPWTGVSGRPTAVSAFTNDSGFVTASGAAAQVNTTNVLNATAGASVGGVGTYALLFSTVGGTYTPGATLAGSSLQYTNTIGTAGGAPSGTWRCMGYLGGSGATLWLRIS